MRVGGDFVYDPTPSSQSHDQSHDLLLIGGGVGINPLFSMLLHHMRLVERKERVGRVKLLYSARSAAELLFKVSRVRYFSVLSPPPSAHDCLSLHRIS